MLKKTLLTFILIQTLLAPVVSGSIQPKIKDNIIQAGNKSLQVSSDGVVKLFSNGRPVAKMSFILNTMRAYFPISSSLVKDKKSAYNPETKTFFYSGKAPLTKNMDRYLSFTRNITLLADGNIKFHYTWDIPSKDKDIKTLGVFINLLGSDKNNKISVDGKIYTPVSPRIFFKSKPRKLKFNVNYPNQEFAIMPRSTAYVTGTFKAKKNKSAGKVGIKIDPGSKSTELTFIMTLGNVAEATKSVHKYAGIDFYALEKMEMPDYRNGKNIFQNPSFEQGFRYLWASFLYFGSYPHPEKWDNAFQIDDKCARFGTKSLKIKTWSANKPRKNSNLSSGYICSLPIPLAPGKYTLSFYAKGNRPGKQLVSVFMPQVHWQKSAQLALPGSEKMKMGVKVGSDWTRYSCVVNIDKSMPARVAFAACSETKDGYVWIDGVQLEKGTKLSEFQIPAVEGFLSTSAKDNFLNSNQGMNARLNVIASSGVNGKADVEIKNFFAEKVFEKTFAFKCGKNSKAIINLPLEGKLDPGIYIIKVTYKLKNGHNKFDFYRFSIMEKLKGNERLRRMFSANYGRQAHNHLFRKILKRNTKLGLSSNTHCEYRMDYILKEYARHNIEVTDSWMAKKAPFKGRDRGSFKIKTGFFYGKTLINGFREENPNEELTEEYLRRFRKAVQKCAELNPEIRRWSLFGEAFCWFPVMCSLDSPEKLYNKYIRLQIAFYEAIKAFDPSLEVTNGDPPNMSQTSGIKLLERQLAAVKDKVKYDHIGIHTYRSSPYNADLDNDTKAIMTMLKRYGYDKTPVYWPEGMHYGPYEIPQWNTKSAAWTPNAGCWYYGTLSYDMGWTEKISAAWRARTWLVALKYQDRISSATSAHGHNNFIMDYALTPFATQKIPHTLTRLLGDAVFKKDIRFAPYTRCYIFEDKNKCPIAVVWGNHPELDNGSINSFTAEIILPSYKLEIFDLMEQKRKFGNGQKIKFPITSFPLFFKGQAGDTGRFIKAFSNATLLSGNGLISPLLLTGVPVSSESLELTVKNQLSKTFKGKLVSNKLNKDFELKPLKSLTYRLALPKPLKKNAIIKEKIDISIQQNRNAKKFNTKLEFRAFLCGRTKNKIKIDGKLDDWNLIPEIPLKNRFIHKNRTTAEKADISAWFKIAWNRDALYICVKVKDDHYFNKIDPLKATSERWNNDSLQIFFDSLGDAIIKQKAVYDDNDYDYAVFPNKDAKSATSFLFASPDPQLTFGPGAPRNRTEAPHIPSAFKRTSDGYVYEVKFPADYLKPAVLKKGMRLGVGIFVNDRDKGSKGVESSLTNTPNGTQCYKKPHLWPSMILTD